MKDLQTPEIWYVTGSQHLYGRETLNQVAGHSQKIVEELNGSERLPLKLVWKPTLTRSEEIRALCIEANSAPNCAGLILWMHTFSPSKMWIGGLSILTKPFLHLHTQFNRDLPWSEIDMDFMNLNQSAHGDREAGFIHTRLRLNRKVVVGHWSDEEVQDRVAAWMRVVRAWSDWQGAKFVRFRRQHARGRGDRRRQGFCRGEVWFFGQRLWYRRPSAARGCSERRRDHQALLRVRRPLYGGEGIAERRKRVTNLSAMAPELRLVFALFSRPTGSKALPPTSKFCTGSNNCRDWLCSV